MFCIVAMILLIRFVSFRFPFPKQGRPFMPFKWQWKRREREDDHDSAKSVGVYWAGETQCVLHFGFDSTSLSLSLSDAPLSSSLNVAHFQE